VEARRQAEAHAALAGEYYQRGNLTVALAEGAARHQVRLELRAGVQHAGAHLHGAARGRPGARGVQPGGCACRPTIPTCSNNFGWFLCLRDDPKRGLELMQRAAADTQYSSPEKAYLSAGLCLRRMGRNEEAEEHLRRAVLIRPDMIGALFNLAVLNFERGQMKDAEIYLLRYMRLATPNLESLIVGVKIARANKDSAAEQSFLQQCGGVSPTPRRLRSFSKSVPSLPWNPWPTTPTASNLLARSLGQTLAAERERQGCRAPTWRSGCT